MKNSKIVGISLKYSLFGIVSGVAEVAAGIAIGKKVYELTENKPMSIAAGVGSSMAITGAVNSVVRPFMQQELMAAVKEDMDAAMENLNIEAESEEI